MCIINILCKNSKTIFDLILEIFCIFVEGSSINTYFHFINNSAWVLNFKVHQASDKYCFAYKYSEVILNKIYGLKFLFRILQIICI